LLNLYRKNPEEAAQQLIKHIQSKVITPKDVKSSFTSRANDPSDWRYQARKDQELDSSEADLEKVTTKSAASTPGGISSFARAVGAQIGRSMSHVGKATADTILNQPARDMGRIEPTTAPAALPAPAASTGMQIPKQKSRVAASPFNDDHSELDQFVKEEFNRHPDDINEESGAVVAHGYAYNRQDQRVAWTREFASEAAAKEWARRRNATVLSIVPKDSIEEGWKSKLAGAALAGSMALGGGGIAHAQGDMNHREVVQQIQSGKIQNAEQLLSVIRNAKNIQTVWKMLQFEAKKAGMTEYATNDSNGINKVIRAISNKKTNEGIASVNNPDAAWPDFGTAKTYESQLAEAKQRLAEGTITKTPTGIKHTGTYGTDEHDPYKSWGRSKTRGRPTKSKYVGRDVDIDEPKKRYGAPSLGVEIGPGATPTRSSPVVSRSHVSATSPIASTGLAFDLPQHVQDKIYAQSDFDRAKKNPGTIGRTKKPNGEVPMLDLDEAESRFVLYWNGKPQTHHATRAEAEKFADTVRAKMPDVKIEIKNEVREQDVAEGVTPATIHKLADRKGVKWDNEPDFLRLTKRLTGKEHLDDLDPAGLQKVKRHLDGLPGVTEGARVDRMVQHIKSSEKATGKSAKDAENIAWATVNKRGMLDNKNKKKGVKEMKMSTDIRAKNRAVVKKIQGKETDIDEGWKQKVAGAALAGAAALGGGAAVAGSQSPNLGIDQFNQPTAVQTAPGSGVPGFSNASGIDQFMKGADLQTTPKAGSMHVDDRDWDTSGYDDHIKSDTKLTKTTTPNGQVKRDSQGRISSVQGPNAQGEYRVFVGQNGKIVSSYVTKTPPQNWMVKEDITQEDIITKLKAKLGDYLSDLGQQIRKDPALQDKIAAKAPGDQVGPAVKTVTTDDGHEISIHGNEDDGFRISIKNKPTPSKFSSLDEAVMACEMYCGHRRRQALNADYVEEA